MGLSSKRLTDVLGESLWYLGDLESWISFLAVCRHHIFKFLCNFAPIGVALVFFDIGMGNVTLPFLLLLLHPAHIALGKLAMRRPSSCHGVGHMAAGSQAV